MIAALIHTLWNVFVETSGQMTSLRQTSFTKQQGSD